MKDIEMVMLLFDSSAYCGLSIDGMVFFHGRFWRRVTARVTTDIGWFTVEGLA